MSLEVTFKENDIKSLQTPMEAEMHKAIKHLEGELIKVRTGRAHTSLVEDLQVSCYGQAPMSLKSFAVLAAPESRLISIQPWDATTISDIEKAIVASDIGITPRNDGKVIWLQLPEMSTHRREELLKILGKKAEECRITLRNVRKEYKNMLTDAKKNKTVSENFFSRLSDVLQNVTDSFEKKVDELVEKKRKEITTI